MPRALRLAGKRTGRSPIEASATDHNHGHFFIWDESSGHQFLVDTGAEVSVLIATGLDTRTAKPGPPHAATNGSTIKTYGARTITLRLA